MKLKFAMVAVAALVAQHAVAAPNLEDVIKQAKADGAHIIECHNGFCYDRDTYSPAPVYEEQHQDGVFIDFTDPEHQNYKLMEETYGKTQNAIKN